MKDPKRVVDVLRQTLITQKNHGEEVALKAESFLEEKKIEKDIENVKKNKRIKEQILKIILFIENISGSYN